MSVENKKYVIMCVGHTHTGKTTFAKKITKAFPSTVLIDNDEIALFIKKQYPSAVLSGYNKVKRDFKNPNLRFLLLRNIYEFCLNTGLNIILSNENLGKDIRTLISRNAKKNGYTLITVYFNIPQEVILERLQNTKKSTKMFVHSKNWAHVLSGQKGYAELPPSKRNTVYFEINNDMDYRTVSKEIGKMLS